MARGGAIAAILGCLMAAAIFFFLGTVFAVGEHDYVYWEIRGTLWGMGVVAVLLGALVGVLAVRADND